MPEAYLIVTVELGGNIVAFETGSGSSTRKHLYAYDNIGAARRQLNIMIAAEHAKQIGVLTKLEAEL